MKILENITRYRCEHCNKEYKVKHATEWHEQHCRLNPNNKHKCFEFCSLLERTSEQIDEVTHSIIFRCNATGKEMYSYIAERKKLVKYHPDAERMPLECDKYKEPTL